jgi:hypothetical protein
MSVEEEFTRIIRSAAWGAETRCGHGSTLEACQAVVKVLPEWFRKFGISTMVDLGCGDWDWMRAVDLTGIRYDGYEVVQDLVLGNQKYETDHIHFHHADVLEIEIPKVDLVLCKDVFGHLPTELSMKLLGAIELSGSKYLASTTSVGWPPQNRVYVRVGGFSPVDLETPPFDLGLPRASVSVPHHPSTPEKLFALWVL